MFLIVREVFHVRRIYISKLNFYRLMHNLFNSWTWTYLIIILNNRIWTATAAPLIVWLLNDSHVQRHADDRVRGMKLNISPYMSVWFRPARTAHYCEMCNCPRPQSATHTQTNYNNNIINSTICSFCTVLMLWGQSIMSLMGTWMVTLVTLCRRSYILLLGWSAIKIKMHVLLLS